MTFEEYLFSKKIDSNSFKNRDRETWEKYCFLFDQMHPNSFTMQKLNIINNLRRNYPIRDEEEVKSVKAKPKRPVIKPKSK